ncbi:Hypothetical protein NTJ_04037 [Nesidiocoris tenuis]|uniref:Uncharacterized protein n=1 Tax=Nesidiocoris tenuis TaxID=355587 RepID=A0ABN7AK34_9HEMI|nr:Hypothetical protein NTJ_04037 [Nesidiocoris tenuis]
MDEDLSQRIHELQFALDLEKKMRLDCEEEVNRLISENGDLREQVAAVKTELLESKRTIREATQNLQLDHDAELMKLSSKIDQLEKESKLEGSNAVSNVQSLATTEEYQKFVDEIDVLSSKVSELHEENQTLKAMRELDALEIQSFQNLVADGKQSYEQAMEALKVKTEELSAMATALEEARDEKVLLNIELMSLKSSATNDERGNSLFKEVADDRKKIVEAYKSLKKKYSVVRNCMVSKNQEIHNLKGELFKLKSKLGDDNKDVDKINGKFASSLQQRIQELEAMVHVLGKRKEEPTIVTLSENDFSNFSWVHTIVDQARNEARKAFEDFQKVSFESVKKSIDLRKNELEKRSLILKCKQLEGQIEGLEMKLAGVEKETRVQGAILSYGNQDDAAEEKTQEPCAGNKTVRFAEDIEETILCGRQDHL